MKPEFIDWEIVVTRNGLERMKTIRVFCLESPVLLFIAACLAGAAACLVFLIAWMCL